jgi:hypothetical protein
VAARTQNVTCAALLAVEAIGSSLMWAPVPVAWMWIGARVYDATGSVAADLGVGLLGFGLTIVVLMKALALVDRRWVEMRRRSGHDQREGALTQVVVVSATFGLAAFTVWYYLLSHAFLLPFMPSQ